jgi:hypothetical protein
MMKNYYKNFLSPTLIKKKTKFSYIYKEIQEIQMGSGAKSYMSEEGLHNIGENAQIFSPFMRRSSSYMALHLNFLINRKI